MRIPLTGALALLCGPLLLASCALLTWDPAPPLCSDGEDNDGDGNFDLADPDCGGDPDASEFGACFDGIDNDGDGLIDAADPACSAGDKDTEGGNECSDNKDNDHDGLTDLDDPKCTDGLGEKEAEACRDGVDSDSPDDPDVDVDLDDWGCQGDPNRDDENFTGGECEDGIDNEAIPDGKKDGEDPQCDPSDPDAKESVECDNGIDDDPSYGDGIDGDDPNCPPADDPAIHFDDSEAPACSNGKDDEGSEPAGEGPAPICTEQGYVRVTPTADGLVDYPDDPQCADPEWDSESVGSCEDGIDNDGDGWKDCEDPDCFSPGSQLCWEDMGDFHPFAQEKTRVDFSHPCADNDSFEDYLIDTEDPDCEHGCDPSELN